MQNMDGNKVIIIGGGPAGLTAAYELSKSDVNSIVFEKDQIVGGIARTVDYKGFHFDIGGHRFFTKVKAVDDRWHEMIGENFLRRKRLSRIYYNKKFFYYPLKATNALIGLGIFRSFLIMASYIYAQAFPDKNEETFETWVSNRFGKYLYNIFFKNYTEKVWGIPCSEISADWAAQRIKGLSLIAALKSALIAQKSGDKKIITTLIDEFNYPKKGPGMMWEAFATRVVSNGSQVRMGSEVKRINWQDSRILSVDVDVNGTLEKVAGNDFISSMPIKELIYGLDPKAPDHVLAAAENLSYRDFLTIVLIVNKDDVFPDNWIYVHDPDVKVGRLQNYKNWSPHMVPDENKTCLGLEYFCFENDELWSMDDEALIDLGTRELEALGFAVASDVVDGTVVRMPKTYPVYDSEYQESIQTIRSFIDSIENLQVIGRNGMHRYNNMDHSMLTAMLASENILGANHDLWAVNSEEEYHEEIERPMEETTESEQAIIRTFARIDKFGFATALGTISGLLIFLATMALVLKGGENIGSNMQLLGQYFIGYTVTIKGAFVGLLYSFIWGFMVGWFIAYIRNFFIALFVFRIKRRIELLTFRDFLDHF